MLPRKPGVYSATRNTVDGALDEQVTGKILTKRVNARIEHGEDLRARQLPEQVKEDKKEK